MIGLVVSSHALVLTARVSMGFSWTDPAYFARLKELQLASSNFFVGHPFLNGFVFLISMSICLNLQRDKMMLWNIFRRIYGTMSGVKVFWGSSRESLSEKRSVKYVCSVKNKGRNKLIKPSSF